MFELTLQEIIQLAVVILLGGMMAYTMLRVGNGYKCNEDV